MDSQRGLTKYQRQRLKLMFDECAKTMHRRPAQRWSEERTAHVISSIDAVFRGERPYFNVIFDDELRVNLSFLIGRLVTILSGASRFSDVEQFEQSHTRTYDPVYTWSVNGVVYKCQWKPLGINAGSQRFLLFWRADSPPPGITSGCSALDILQGLHDRLTALELRALPPADPGNPQTLSSSPSACPPASRRSAGRPPRPPWTTCSGTRRT
jgi:hypothetical protein